MDTPTICISLIAIGISFAVYRINRPHNISDEIADGDIRTTALCKIINEGE